MESGVKGVGGGGVLKKKLFGGLVGVRGALLQWPLGLCGRRHTARSETPFSADAGRGIRGVGAANEEMSVDMKYWIRVQQIDE